MPLAGVRVVSMALNIPGPVAAHRLVTLGADVTKVEPPAGDQLELHAPAWYRSLHAGQTVERVDLRSDDGVERLHQILAGGDLLLTSQRAGSLRRIGLAWDDLHHRHPRLGHVAIAGFSPPDSDVPGHDLTYVARAGLVDAPRMPRTLLADLAGAERAVSAALALLLERERSGSVGRREVALAEVAEDFAAPLRHGLTSAGGPLGGGFPGYGVYAARVGWVAVAAIEPGFQRRLCELLGLASLDRAGLERVLKTRSAEEWSLWAREHDVPLASLEMTPGSGGRPPE